MHRQTLSDSRLDTLSWITMTAVAVCVGLIAALAAASATFGSIPSSFAYLRGDRLILRTATQSFGILEQGSKSFVTFELVNMTDRLVKLIGANSSCTCVVADDLPTSIPAGARKNLRIQVFLAADKEVGPINQTVTLYTDYPSQPSILLQINGESVERSASSKPTGLD